jgi:hypothetical protein
MSPLIGWRDEFSRLQKVGMAQSGGYVSGIPLRATKITNGE